MAKQKINIEKERRKTKREDLHFAKRCFKVNKIKINWNKKEKELND